MRWTSQCTSQKSWMLALINSFYLLQQGCPWWGLGQELPLLQRQTDREHVARPRQCTMERHAMMPAYRSPSEPDCNISTSTLAFDQRFTTTAKGSLLSTEIVSVKQILWLQKHYYSHHQNGRNGSLSVWIRTTDFSLNDNVTITAMWHNVC